MCTLCGDTGFIKAPRLGVGNSAGFTLWQDFDTYVPCWCVSNKFWQREPIYVQAPPIVVPGTT
jgi:hypothetical protein